MKELIFLLIGLFVGAGLGYFLLKLVLPPILSRALDVRDRYYELREQFSDLRKRIEKGKESKQELVNEIDAFLEKHGVK